MSKVAYLESSLTEDRSNQRSSQLKIFYDEKHKTGWVLMDGSPVPAFTPRLLNSLSNYIQKVKQEMHESKGEKYDFLVLGSEVEGVFNYGGDLKLFAELIRKNDKATLLQYALHCVNLSYQSITHLDADLTTISLIQGDALGGGFEAAIACNVVIAEKGSKLGLPESLFNLFPGMGAYSILSRKVGSAMAERMILSGKVYSAEELHEMGLIDVLAEKGEGELAVYSYISTAQKSPNTYQSMRRVKDICNDVRYEELIEIGTEWVDAALNLRDQDLRMMERLVRKQRVK